MTLNNHYSIIKHNLFQFVLFKKGLIQRGMSHLINIHVCAMSPLYANATTCHAVCAVKPEG